MESFIISATLGNEPVQILVVPEDCIEHSLFHLVVNNTEIIKILYTDTRRWEIIEGTSVKAEELTFITQQIERQFHL